MIRPALLALAALPGLAPADTWRFEAPLDVTPVFGPGVFHHLESSGRRSIAAGLQRVAVVWEDERDGTPRVYLATRRHGDSAFRADAAPLSGPGEAFEPGIAALDGGRFVIGWEEDGRTRLRVLGFAGNGTMQPGPVTTLGGDEAGQVSLAAQGAAVLAVWSERTGRHRGIRFARLRVDPDGRLHPVASCTVDAERPSADQLYPTVVGTASRTVVAWEDRRPGHTIIMAAHAPGDRGCEFSAPQRISEQPPGRKAPYGAGHGTSRVALAAYGDGQVLAAWADKRDFRHGYDIYGASLQDDGRFGANLRLQDDFGELSQQWHTTLAGHPGGRLVAAWNDKREGNADIVLSWPQDDAWSDDTKVPGASGAGEQQHPTLTFDPNGRLHLAWVHRDAPGGPTRLRYAMGRHLPEQ